MFEYVFELAGNKFLQQSVTKFMTHLGARAKGLYAQDWKLNV